MSPYLRGRPVFGPVARNRILRTRLSRASRYFIEPHSLSLSLAVIKVGGSILLRRVYKYVFILNINFSSEGMCSDGSSETSSIRIITARRPLYFLTYSIINLNPSNFLDSFDGA